MNGRLELQQKDLTKCNSILSTLPPYVSSWYSYLRVSGNSPKTCLNYLYKVADFLRTYNSLDRDSVNAYLISKQTVVKNGSITQSSKATQQLAWSSLNSFFTYLEDEGIAPNPIKPGSRPSGDDLNANRTLLTKDDFNAILNTIKAGHGSEHKRNYLDKTKSRDMAIMYLFMCTGLRESALISINKENITNGTLFIYDKGEKPHEFILTDNCKAAIATYLSTREDDLDALFVVTRAGETSRMSIQNIIAIVKKYTEAALGKPLSPHKLRAGVCSILYQETGDIEFVRRFIGHSSTNITKRYIVTNGNEKERGNKLLSGF